MSYSTIDRYGDIKTTYVKNAADKGVKTWWPDFGGGREDFSSQRLSHPAESIYDRLFKPKSQSEAALKQGRPLFAEQFRKVGTSVDYNVDLARKKEAHAIVERRGQLRLLEQRQKKMDAWLDRAPAHVTPYLLDGGPDQDSKPLQKSSSEPTVGANITALGAASASRAVYEKHGFLVGRHSGMIADGKKGAPGSIRRHNPLSMQAMLLQTAVSDSRSSSSSFPAQRVRPRKPGKQWKLQPENRFVFDPRTFLPVPKGGWDNHELSSVEWPDLPPLGARDLHDKNVFS